MSYDVFNMLDKESDEFYLVADIMMKYTRGQQISVKRFMQSTSSTPVL